MTIWDRLKSEINDRGLSDAESVCILVRIADRHPGVLLSNPEGGNVGFYALLFQEMQDEVYKFKHADQPI